MQPTRIIETPVGKHKVEIKEWITGRDREYINEPMYTAVNTKPTVVAGKPDVSFGNFDVNKYLTESSHREIETFVVSVDGKKEKVLDAVLNMHEQDTEFVKAEIDKTSKKNATPNT